MGGQSFLVGFPLSSLQLERLPLWELNRDSAKQFQIQVVPALLSTAQTTDI